MNIRHTVLLIVLLLLAAWSVAGGEDAKPTNTQTKKKIAEYITADEAGREKLSSYFKGLPPLARKDCAKWLAEIQNAAAAQLKKAVQKVLGKDDETFAKAGVFNVEAAGAKMKYFFRTGGKRGANGYPLYINLHGGGDSAEVNESAWETAKGQYSVSGSLIVPRSTQDVALSWAVPEAWPLIDRLLYESFLLRDVDPDSVYLMGYSMGGWGTLLMAPAMADRWAACAASAGGEHVQRAFPENLRNTPIIIQIGTDDNAFQRYALSKAYADKLKELKAADPDGYKYEYKEHKGAAHQIDDSGNPKWLAQYTRDTYPKKIVWRPVEATGGYVKTFYYIKLDEVKGIPEIVVLRDGNNITIQTAKSVSEMTLMFNDSFIDLDKPVKVVSDGKTVYNGCPRRSLLTMLESFLQRGDSRMTFSAEIKIEP